MDQKKEAIARMKKLNLYDQIIEDFEKSGKVYASETKYGILYDLTEEEEDAVKEFEEEYGALVYHCIRNNFEFGRCLSMLYVSKYIEDWEIDNEDIPYGVQYAFVKNFDDDMCSEIGTIGILPINGGIRRTA